MPDKIYDKHVIIVRETCWAKVYILLQITVQVELDALLVWLGLTNFFVQVTQYKPYKKTNSTTI